MARKTHPIGHRLGVTVWWPTRTPTYGRKTRTQSSGRYVVLTKLIKGILAKFGYYLSSPYIEETLNSKGRILLLVSKKEERLKEGESTLSSLSYLQGPASNRIDYAKLGIALRDKIIELDRSSVLVTTYIISYISELLAEYEKCLYTIDIREIEEITTQGTANIIAQIVADNDKNLFLAMLDMQRKVSKSQANLDQSAESHGQ